MQTCLPFMLLSSSIPLTLQSNVNDPAFSDLATEQRPESSLSNYREEVDTQPSRAASAAPLYRRFSAYERRRAHSAPPDGLPSVGISDTTRKLSARMRKTRSAPGTLDLPVVHDGWIRVRDTDKDKGKRRVSDPVKPADPVVGDEGTKTPSKRSSNPPRSRSSSRSSYSLSSPRQSLDSSRLSTSSTLIPPMPPPCSQPERCGSLLPPSPLLQTLQEDVEFQAPLLSAIQVDSRLDWSPLWPSPCSLEEQILEEYGPSRSRCLSRPSSKKVSFSQIKDEVITSPEPVQEQTTSLRSQSSWSGFLLLNKQPVAARPPLARQSSLPSVRGQAAGKSILRRTSSFTNDAPPGERKSPVEHIPVSPVIERNLKRLPRSKSGRPLIHNPSSSPMPSVLEVGPVFKETIGTHLPPMIMRTPSPSSDTSSIKSCSSSASSVRSDREAGIFETVDFSDAIQITKPKVASIVVPPARPRKPSPAFTLEQRAVRHWSMQGNGSWIRRSGVYAEGKRAREVVPPVPPLPKNVEASAA